MAKCIPCSKVKQSEKDIIKYYKQLYEQGIEYYVYRLEKGGNIKFVERSGFNHVFENQIKPNFSSGAEYFHITEFNL